MIPRAAYNIANSLRMKRSQFKGTFLVVEGEDDSKCYGRFVDECHCRITVAYGRPNVIGVLTILEGEAFAGVLGIVDADFSTILGDLPKSHNILVTDAHDLEVMQIQSPALERVLTELGDPDAIERYRQEHGKTVRDGLFDLGSAIGYFRFVSSREGWGIKFDGICFDSFIDERKLVCDTVALYRAADQLSRTVVPHDVGEHIERARVGTVDLSHVCNGHDLMEVLGIGLRRVWGKRLPAETSAERVSMLIRVAYDDGCFLSTALCAAIRAWETGNIPFKVLKSQL